MDERAPRKWPAKKTGTIEFRVATEDKNAFLDACEQEGRPASGVLREAMAHFVRNRRIAPSRWSRIMPNSVLAASLALVFAVQSSDRLPGAERPYAIAEFDYYDLNSDGRLTLHEYLRSFGSVRDLANNREGVREAGRVGGVFGNFLAFGVHSSGVLFDHPDQISEACWRAVEDNQLVQITNTFNSFDSNGDGIVNAEEFGAHQLERHRVVFERGMDANGDGVVTQEDYDAHATEVVSAANERPRRIERLPDPGSFNENTPDFIRTCAPEFARISRAHPAPPERASESAQRFRDGEMMDYLDLDGDGVITFTEYATVMERNWTRR